MRHQLNHLILVVVAVLAGSCVYDQIEPIRPPGPGVESEDLTAKRVQNPPLTFADSYWFTADYKRVTLSDIVTQQVASEDGILNTTGTFNGLSQFNNGVDPELTLKAGYDSENLYILVSWQDRTYGASNLSWIYNGDGDNHRPGVDPAGWTAQRGDDRLEMRFKKSDTEHDVWLWSLALSDPLGYAIDKFDNGSETVDPNDLSFQPNMAGADYRSGPRYEWDGTQQEILRELSGLTILDQGYFLLNKTDFAGDILAGDATYQNTCANCHGAKADGDGDDWATGVALNQPNGPYNRISRAGFESIVDVDTHDGQSYWTALNATEKSNVITRIKGFAGVPGYYLEEPQGVKPDVKALSNVLLAKVPFSNTNGYQVILVRKLNTANANDIVFDTNGNTYQLKVNLFDNDRINKVGSADYINLIFK